jgi:Fur family ferric uptake transcriptional regulator
VGSGDAPELNEVVAARLDARDYRYTRGRRALVEALAEADGPVTIGEILGRDDSLSISSTYRNLAVLEDAGVVHRIVTTDEHPRFELDDAITDWHHHHLVCAGCGTVLDFTIPDVLEENLERVLRRVARANGFTSEHHRLDLIGRCRACA